MALPNGAPAGPGYTFAICNQKGGTGKTTTTFHVGRAAARRGLRVLLIDMDPQGNLTTLAASEPVESPQQGVEHTISQLAGYTPMSEVLVPARWPGVELVPTLGWTLAVVRNELVAATDGQRTRLRKALAEIRDRYDLVLIDCPPSVDHLTANALTAADAALIVTESSALGGEGVAQMLRAIEDVRANKNPNLTISGVLVNNHEAGTYSGKEWLEKLRQHVHVLDPVIPKRVVIRDACHAGVGLDEWPGTRGWTTATLYDDLLTKLIGGNAHGAA